MAPVSVSRLLKKGFYPFSRSAAAGCIPCARVAIPVSWSMMAKPPSWGSMPVMRCSLSVQAAGPRRRRSVSWRDRSGSTRPLRRFHERNHRASSAVSSWSQPSRIGIAAGSAGAARAPGCAGAMGCGEPVPSGAHRGARGASPAGMDPCWAALPVPGGAPGASSSPSAWSAAWVGGRRAYGLCHEEQPEKKVKRELQVKKEMQCCRCGYAIKKNAVGVQRSVTCDICHAVYHMSCAKLRFPPKFGSWACESCVRDMIGSK